MTEPADEISGIPTNAQLRRGRDRHTGGNFPSTTRDEELRRVFALGGIDLDNVDDREWLSAFLRNAVEHGERLAARRAFRQKTFIGTIGAIGVAIIAVLVPVIIDFVRASVGKWLTPP